MREIKFRAWDKEIKKMWEVGEIHFPLREYSVVYLMEPGTSKKTYSKFVELMQYTGLKDKNGTEIYEGDIVLDDQGGRYQVKWSNSEVGFRLRADDEQYYGWRLEYEVIGNIYENYDLLKGNL